MTENLKQTTETKARECCGGLVAAEGMELVDLEFVHEHQGWVLRVLIDKPGGVTIEDCTRISRAIEPALDVEDFIHHEYHLEVSSPGLNRPLTKPAHFRSAEGKRIKVKTFGPIGEPPRKNFTGTLKGVEDDAITVNVEGAGTARIPLRNIAKANLQFEF